MNKRRRTRTDNRALVTVGRYAYPLAYSHTGTVCNKNMRLITSRNTEISYFLGNAHAHAHASGLGASPAELGLVTRIGLGTSGRPGSTTDA